MSEFKYFTDQWLELSPKEKAKFILDQCQGLSFEILYLDDEQDHLDMMSDLSQELGLAMIGFTDPLEALNYIQKNQMRLMLVISDMKMPMMDGFLFRQKIIAINSDIPFAILTGFMTQEIALKGVDGKISAFLEKPIRREDLTKILREHVENHLTSIVDEYDLLRGFIEDAKNLLQDVEDLCLEMEEDSHNLGQKVSRIFGAIHTIKGSSGFFEPRTLHNFAHCFEESLKGAQGNQELVNSNLISSWLKATDVLKKLIEELKLGQHNNHSFEDFKKLFDTDSTTSAPTDDIDSKVKSTEHTSEVIEKIKGPSEIKVSMEVLDQFMSTSGELTVIRNIVNKTVLLLEKKYSGDKEVSTLTELLGEMHKINSDVQNKITEIRRVSAKQVTKPLSRIVRDTGRALKKKFDFKIEGENLRLDHSIVETLNKCLVHMVRNSIDHGLELPEERLKCGKPESGVLFLGIEVIDEKIVVTLKDDGKGINTEKIKEIAIERNVKTKEHIAEMSDEEVHLLLFEAGFSTAKEVTDFSGRGVGMSMVKDLISSHEGEIKIQSKFGQGTVFTLVIPLPSSVMITNGLFIKCGETTLAIPQTSVARVYQLDSGNQLKVKSLAKGEFIDFENNLIPLISLNAFLQEAGNEKSVIVLENKDQFMAIKVSEVLDIEDVVVKNLPFYQLDSLGIFQGATFLSNSMVGLVISIEGLFKSLDIVNKKKAPTIIKDEVNLDSASYVICELFEDGLYAVPQESVVRIERFALEAIQRSNKISCVSYRDQVLSLANLSTNIDELFKFHQFKEQELIVLVIEKNKKLLGLVVQKIVDLDSISGQWERPLKSNPLIEGRVLYKDQCLTLLNIDSILNQVTAISPNKQVLEKAA